LEEGDKVVEEEADSAKSDTTRNNTENTTSTTSKMFQTHEAECLVEGGAIMSYQADKTVTPFNVDTVANSAIRRQGVGRRRASRLSQADNSLTMPQTPTMKIVAKCS
jgi:hypothetical protein